MRGLLLLAAFAGIAVLGLGWLLSRNEVVTLRTVDAYGVEHETTLWIVDAGEDTYLRAGRPAAQWYQRLSRSPRIEIVRDGRVLPYVAVPVLDDRVRAGVNEAMARKYGFAASVIDLALDLDDSVPIRLEPRPAEKPIDMEPASP